MPRKSKRDQLLAAALSVVRRDGTDALTLDAVAAAAGVSKGGLLYHFDSKEALVRGLVELLVQGFDAQLQHHDDGTPGSFTRAYLEATVHPAPGADDATAGLLAAVALAPHLLEPLRAQYRTWAKRLDADRIDVVDAWVVRLATDGLWMAELLGFEPPPRARRAQVIERLRGLTQRTPHAPQAPKARATTTSRTRRSPRAPD